MLAESRLVGLSFLRQFGTPLKFLLFRSQAQVHLDRQVVVEILLGLRLCEWLLGVYLVVEHCGAQELPPERDQQLS